MVEEPYPLDRWHFLAIVIVIIVVPCQELCLFSCEAHVYFALGIFKEESGWVMSYKLSSCFSRMWSTNYKVIVLIMLSHVKCLICGTFFRIHHYNKRYNCSMWIYFHFFLEILNMHSMWPSNLKWSSSCFHIYWWPMNVCYRQIEDMPFSHQFPLHQLSTNLILLRRQDTGCYVTGMTK